MWSWQDNVFNSKIFYQKYSVKLLCKQMLCCFTNPKQSSLLVGKWSSVAYPKWVLWRSVLKVSSRYESIPVWYLSVLTLISSVSLKACHLYIQSCWCHFKLLFLLILFCSSSKPCKSGLNRQRQVQPLSVNYALFRVISEAVILALHAGLSVN